MGRVCSYSAYSCSACAFVVQPTLDVECHVYRRGGSQNTCGRRLVVVEVAPLFNLEVVGWLHRERHTCRCHRGLLSCTIPYPSIRVHARGCQSSSCMSSIHAVRSAALGHIISKSSSASFHIDLEEAEEHQTLSWMESAGASCLIKNCLRDLAGFLTGPILDRDILRLRKSFSTAPSSECVPDGDSDTHRLKYPPSVLCTGLRVWHRGQRISLWSRPPRCCARRSYI